MPLNTATLTLMALRTAPDSKVVTLGASSTYGVLNDDQQMGTDGSGEDVIVHSRELFVTAGSLTGIVDGATTVIGGVSYTVRGRPMPRENGDLWAIRVTRVPA